MVAEIRRLADERDVTIMAHNYQIPPIQDLADLVGDSLVLAMEGPRVESDTILFCGVAFMAETVKILAPTKRVIHPIPDSRCPMAGMVDHEILRGLREEHPGAPVVAYVNTTAETKAVSDVCCTSANAVDVVRSLPEPTVIFVPDRNLGSYVQRMVPEKEVVLYPGYCHVHDGITLNDVGRLREAHPGAGVLAHPECRPEVLEASDHVYSTEGMIRHAARSSADEFIVLTEKELAYRLETVTGKRAYAPDAVCPNMKKITLEGVLEALRTGGPDIVLDRNLMGRARRPILRMLGD
ncbi:MAG TPA: quinolinate synthase NadA [Thermoplasmata archaeon]|nr:quinolinate synthase NadA [Thermoplasmata archaeon]